MFHTHTCRQLICFIFIITSALSFILFTPSHDALASAASDSTRLTLQKPLNKQPRTCIALGAGGANGLSHIMMLEVLDELGITPYHISGSSIGAIIGALYASGMSASDIRRLVEQFIISDKEPVVEELLNKQAIQWIEFIELDVGKGGLLSSEGFISYLYSSIKLDSFEQLRIPLTVVAADLWRKQQVVLDSGPLLPAIKASMSLPGIFQPVIINDRVLIDGGTVNPVPFDLLPGTCDITIAIDVSGIRPPPANGIPGYFETVFNSVKVMHEAIVSEKLKHNQPTIYLAPPITNVRALEFYKAEHVFQQSIPSRERLKSELQRLLNVKP